MSGTVRLGLRLARGRERGERARGVATLLAHLVGVWVMLVVVAAVRAEIALPSYDGNALPLLVLTVVATVGVPVAVLLATMTRLSAALRDRRLVSLRVLGLSARRTRVVAAVEAGTGAVIGSLLGLVAFWVSRPGVRGLDVAGRDWSSGVFAPWPVAVVLLVVGLPMVSVLVALVPGARQSSAVSAGPPPLAPVTSPSLWRVAPLAVGLVTVWWVATLRPDQNPGYARFWVLVAGGVLAAVGLVLVIPVFTRLVADLVLRVHGRPSLRIAGRRLQVQPAGVSRIVAGLLIGLFVVAGSRMVLSAFESSTQYEVAERMAAGGQVQYDVSTTPGTDVIRLADRVGSNDSVLAAYPSWRVSTACGEGQPCLSAFVGTCDDLVAAVPDARGCRDDQVAWLDGDAHEQTDVAGSTSLTWSTGQQEADGTPVGPTVTLDTPEVADAITSRSDEYAVSNAMQAQVFIPEDTRGIGAVLAASQAESSPTVAVQVDAGDVSEAQLAALVRAVDPTAEVYNPWEDDSYDFVAGLRALVWGVAGLVLALGLVGFAVATIDRAVSRRAEMVSLQLIGTGRRVIRAAQWWEAAVPLVLGVFLAIGTGSLVGYGYLTNAEEGVRVPWSSIVALAGISAVAAVGVAGLTVVACAPRIRAELIRRA